MQDCCDPRGHERVFDEATARADAQRYLVGGLDATGRRIVDALAARELQGASVLEVGGGVGALQVELLATGASRAVNVELVRSYEAPARELARDRGIDDRIQRHVLDFAKEGDRVGPTDIVVLHRVVCCYPDMPALMHQATRHAGRYLALSYPSGASWRRVSIALENLLHRLRGRTFRAYVHDPEAIRREVERGGFRAVFDGGDLMWRVTVFERVGP